MAASLVVSLPTIVVFVVMQRHLIAGALSGAVKA
jgi:ABC-type glycerol-3-phosphate transport system permease component